MPLLSCATLNKKEENKYFFFWPTYSRVWNIRYTLRVYLEPCQASMMKHFFQNSWRLLAATIFAKTLHHGYFTGSKYVVTLSLYTRTYLPNEIVPSSQLDCECEKHQLM